MNAPATYEMQFSGEGGDCDDFDLLPDADAGSVEVDKDLYPQCIVWTPIPGCTWCFPFIGHMGIGTTKGEVLEFMGFGASRAPRGGLSFGPVCRYLPLSASLVTRGTWDQGVANAAKKVRGNPHGACVSNCHTFVAEALHEMRYAGIPCWNWLSYLLAVWVFLLGRFTTIPRTACYAIPCSIAVAIIFVLCTSTRSN